MEWFLDYWHIILGGVVIVFLLVVAIIDFTKLPTADKIEKIKAWLLQAVILAEREFGAKTGKVKLSTVYAMFCKELPWLAKIVDFERFSDLVDESLVQMRDMLNTNKEVADIVLGDNSGD